MKSLYEQRLEKTQKHKLWDKLDFSMRIGYSAIFGLSLFAVLLGFTSLSWAFPTQMISLVVILVVAISTLIFPSILFGIKLTRSFLLWNSFKRYDKEVYEGGYMAFEMLKDFLKKEPSVHSIWLKEVVNRDYHVSWKDLHTSVRSLSILFQIKWCFKWWFSEESYPVTHSYIKPALNSQNCWEELLGKDSIEKARVIHQKEVLLDSVPKASKDASLKKHARL